MMYKGVEYDNLYSRAGKMYKTVGFSRDFDTTDKNIIFADLITGDVYHMAEDEFEGKFEKVNKYT